MLQLLLPEIKSKCECIWCLESLSNLCKVCGSGERAKISYQDRENCRAIIGKVPTAIFAMLENLCIEHRTFQSSPQEATAILSQQVEPSRLVRKISRGSRFKIFHRIAFLCLLHLGFRIELGSIDNFQGILCRMHKVNSKLGYALVSRPERYYRFEYQTGRIGCS